MISFTVLKTITAQQRSKWTFIHIRPSATSLERATCVFILTPSTSETSNFTFRAVS